MATRKHMAIAFAGAGKPLEAIRVPTVSPVAAAAAASSSDGDADEEILIRSRFAASTPLDLHRADGGLLSQPGDLFGSTTVGVVEEVGPRTSGRLRVGDRVLGWAFQKPRHRAHQEYVTAPEWMFGKIPDNISLEEAATVPENLITAFNTLATDLGLPTPWPKPEGYAPPRADAPILVWGAASSVGQFTLQVLRWYGYRRVLATASPRHHDYLASLGASACFDYRDAGVAEKILAEASDMRRSSSGSGSGDGVAATAAAAAAAADAPAVPFIIDCIGSRDGSLKPILAQKIAQPGAVVAVMLPVILTHTGPDRTPEYAMDASAVARDLLGTEEGTASAADDAGGVTVKGVRTFFVYDRNAFFKEKLPSEIIPALLAEGVVTPQRYRLVEGQTMLEREEAALQQMREGSVSGEKLVWRTSEQ